MAEQAQAFDSFETLIGHLVRQIVCGPLLVAVGGATACGKTTFARRLRDALSASGKNALIFEGDRFLVPHTRRGKSAVFPHSVYEIDKLLAAVTALAQQQPVTAPFYEKDGWATGRITVAPGTVKLPSVVIDDCRPRMAKPDSALTVDEQTGDVLEVITPGDEIWVFDSELSLFLDVLKPLYSVSVGIRATRSVRRRNFLSAVGRGERYPLLTPIEAIAKIEGFWKTDDELIEPTVDMADYMLVVT